MKQTLEERLTALRADMRAVVDAYVDARCAQVPGIHRSGVENAVLGRAGGCECEQFRVVLAKIEAERKLAERQQADVQVRTG